MQVTADVNEDDIARVKAGQRTLLRHEGFLADQLNATVSRVTPKGDPTTKTFRVHLALPDDTPLLIGMSVEANIITDERQDTLLLPAEALSDGHVFVFTNDKMQKKAVTTGIRGTRMVEIKDGVAEGEQIIAPCHKDQRHYANSRIRHRSMTLIFDIAWTHVTARLRQTLVGIFGVATGIGFSVMMAGLLEGSQKTLSDNLSTRCRIFPSPMNSAKCQRNRRQNNLMWLNFEASPQKPKDEASKIHSRLWKRSEAGFRVR